MVSLANQSTTVAQQIPKQPGVPSPFTQDEYVWIEFSTAVIVSFPLVILGIVTNIINLVIFYRQGILSNSPTVTLTFLAIADLSTCILHFWYMILTTLDLWVDASYFNFHVYDAIKYLGGRPTSMLSQDTCVITAFAAFERMISVVLPFKVKSIFTPIRTVIIMVFIYVTGIILYIPAWIDQLPVWVINPATNSSFLKWKHSNLISLGLWRAFFYTNQISIRFTTISLVVLCNVVIFWKVVLSQKFRNRKSGTSSSISEKRSDGKDVDKRDDETGGKNMSTKDTRLLRMIAAISIMFMVCYIPYIVFATTFYVALEDSVDYHWHVPAVTRHFVFLLQMINSSCNLFIYYTMSSRYREDFQQLLCKLSKS